jgi:hypothetical protein
MECVESVWGVNFEGTWIFGKLHAFLSATRMVQNRTQIGLARTLRIHRIHPFIWRAI